MKIRDRLSFFQGSAADDGKTSEADPLAAVEARSPSDETHEVRSIVEPEDDRPEEPAGRPEAPAVAAVEESNGNRMRGAFAAVAQVVSGEVESVRRSLGELEKALNRRAETEKEARSAAVDALKRELASRIEELTRGQEKATAELKQAAEREREQVDRRVDELKQALEQSLAAKVEKLEAGLDGLARNVAALQGELQRQIETSERVTGLLNNMAGVFSVNQAPAGAAQPGAGTRATGTPGATGGPRSGMVPQETDPQELDDALQRVFK